MDGLFELDPVQITILGGLATLAITIALFMVIIYFGDKKG